MFRSPSLRRCIGCLLLGCLSWVHLFANDVGPNGRIIIDYWEKWAGPEAEAMQAIVNDFNRAQSCIEVRFLSTSPIDVKLLLAASSGNPPDLAGLWSFSIPDFAEKGALLPLDAALADAQLGADHYIPLFWELCRHRDFTWGLPTTPGCVALFYNKRLFRAAGLDPESPPRTFEELEQMSRRLTVVELERDGRRTRVSFADLTPQEVSDRRYTIVQVGHLPYDAGFFLSAWGFWFGATFYDGDRRILASEDANIAAFTWLQESILTYGQKNLRDFGASYGLSQTAQSPFLGGQAGMVVQGPWMRNFIEKYSPDLEWGVTPCPAAPGVSDDAPVTIVESDVIVIPKGAKHPREAFEFIRYLQRTEVAEKLAAAQGKFTALREVSPTFIENHPNPAIGTFVEIARSPGARAVPRLSIWREYDMEMSIAAERVRNLTRKPKAALDEAQERLQWRFDRVLRRWDIVKDERLEEWRENAQW